MVRYAAIVHYIFLLSILAHSAYSRRSSSPRTAQRCRLLALSTRHSPECGQESSAAPGSPIYPLLVTGPGRSGTLHTATLLSTLGIRVSHDNRFDPLRGGLRRTHAGPLRDGSVSWIYAFDDKNYPAWAGDLNGARFRSVFMQMRHPLRVIASRAAAPLGHSSEEFVRRHVDMPAHRTTYAGDLHSALHYWIGWSGFLLKVADWTYRLEDGVDVPELCHRAGLPSCPSSSLVDRAIATAAAARAGSKANHIEVSQRALTWDVLMRVDPHATQQARALACSYGGYDCDRPTLLPSSSSDLNGGGTGAAAVAVDLMPNMLSVDASEPALLRGFYGYTVAICARVPVFTPPDDLRSWIEFHRAAGIYKFALYYEGEIVEQQQQDTFVSTNRPESSDAWDEEGTKDADATTARPSNPQSSTYSPYSLGALLTEYASQDALVRIMRPSMLSGVDATSDFDYAAHCARTNPDRARFLLFLNAPYDYVYPLGNSTTSLSSTLDAACGAKDARLLDNARVSEPFAVRVPLRLYGASGHRLRPEQTDRKEQMRRRRRQKRATLSKQPPFTRYTTQADESMQHPTNAAVLMDVSICEKKEGMGVYSAELCARAASQAIANSQMLGASPPLESGSNQRSDSCIRQALVGGRRLLLSVEDQLRVLLVETLSKGGNDSTSIGTAIEALARKLRSNTPDDDAMALYDTLEVFAGAIGGAMLEQTTMDSLQVASARIVTAARQDSSNSGRSSDDTDANQNVERYIPLIWANMRQVDAAITAAAASGAYVQPEERLPSEAAANAVIVGEGPRDLQRLVAPLDRHGHCNAFFSATREAESAPSFEEGTTLRFLHIPKTGGTTLNDLLEVAAPLSKRVFCELATKKLTLQHIPDLYKNCDVISGEFDGSHRFQLPIADTGPVADLVLLRDPIRRAISQYEHLRYKGRFTQAEVETGGSNKWDTVARGLFTGSSCSAKWAHDICARLTDGDKCLGGGFCGLLRNHQTQMLAGARLFAPQLRMAVRETPQRLLCTAQRALSSMSIVGITDYYGVSVCLLLHAIRWWDLFDDCCRGEPGVLSCASLASKHQSNVRDARATIKRGAQVSSAYAERYLSNPELMRAMAVGNELDCALYAAGMRRFLAQVRSVEQATGTRLFPENSYPPPYSESCRQYGAI